MKELKTVRTRIYGIKGFSGLQKSSVDYVAIPCIANFYEYHGDAIFVFS